MQNNYFQIPGERTQEGGFNSSMINLLNIDMQEMLRKYILEWLVQKYTMGRLGNGFLTNQINSEVNNAVLPLNELIKQRRQNIIVPIPVYGSQKLTEPVDDSRDRIESISTAKDEQTPRSHVRESPMSPTKVVENELTPEKPKTNKKKSKDKLKLIKMDLAFENEGGDLATRWDVVYKTILRDFRRYFLDGYKAFNSTYKERHGMEDSLLKYAIKLFPNMSVDQWKTISLDLGSLLFPKETAKDSHILKEMERRNHFGWEKSDIVNQIMKIHGFLYKFSIDKIEECFQNFSLCQLFDLYAKETGIERISSNSTMSRNASIYLKARKILMSKASKTISLLKSY